MAVGYVASASSGSQASVASFNIGTLGTGARAGIVFVCIHNSSTDIITGVTWNGTAMTLLYKASDTDTEPGLVKAYFLDNVTNGLVTVSRTNNTVVTVGYAASISTTAGIAAEVAQVKTQGGSSAAQTNADGTGTGTGGTPGELALDDGSLSGTDSMRFAAHFTGAATPLAAGANSTNLQVLDSTSYGSRFVRETTAGQGSRSVGFADGSDDWAYVGVAVRERVRAGTGALTATPVVVSGTADIPPRSTSVAEVSLASGSDPGVNTGHAIKVRARVTTGAGTAVLKAALYEGANNRSGDLTTSALTNSLADYTLAISEANAANITSYANLGIRFWGYDSAGVGLTFEVDSIYLETPAAAAVPEATGAVVVPPVAIVGTGATPYASTGALTGTPSLIVGTTLQTLSATGALAVPSDSIVGTAKTTHASTGALAGTASTVSGTAKATHAATGAVAGTPATVSGTVTETVSATGAVTVPSDLIAGTAAQTLSASGTLTGQPGVIVGTAAETFAATGALTSGSDLIAGTAAQTLSATGAVTGAPVIVDGDATNVVPEEPPTATGALTGAPVVIAGTGATPYVGTGALTGSPPTVSGTAAQALAATGALTGQPPAIAGTATSLTGVVATGAVTGQPPLVAGTGATPYTSQGQVVHVAPTLDGTALVQIVGSGAITSSGVAIGGTGAYPSTGTGAITTPSVVISGTGQHGEVEEIATPAGYYRRQPLPRPKPQPIVGSGAIVISPVLIAGQARAELDDLWLYLDPAAYLAGVT